MGKSYYIERGKTTYNITQTKQNTKYVAPIHKHPCIVWINHLDDAVCPSSCPRKYSMSVECVLVCVCLSVCMCASLPDMPSIYTRCYPVLAPWVCLLRPMYPKTSVEYLLSKKRKNGLITLAESTVTSVMSDITCCYLYFSISKRAKSRAVTLPTCRSVTPPHALGWIPFSSPLVGSL